MAEVRDETTLIKCTDAEDPKRCQGIDANGQCWYRSNKNATMCPRHGGNMEEAKVEKESTDMYRIDMWKARISRQKMHPEVKSLANEVAILRMLMEEKLRICVDDTTLLLASSSISELVMKIDKVVTSCHKLEKNLGLHMDKAAILQFGGEIIQLITEKVTNKNEVGEVADGILAIIGEMDGSKDSKDRA